MIKRLLRNALSPSLWGHRSSELGLARLSWSQFGEDLLIKTLFRDKEVGTYADIGAFQPIHLSNTYKLYREGWRGIAVDANPEMAAPFVKYRARDKFLHSAVGTKKGPIEFYKFSMPEYNCEASNVDMTPEKIRKTGVKIKVECRSLEEIFSIYNVKQLDFLNIDCEGADLDILQSNNWTKIRPSVICVEDHSKDWQNSSVNSYLSGLGYKLGFRAGPSSIFIEAQFEG